ncbi:hypothetical protein Poly24_00530 [Rosistilla carotiformis]|uniref:Uncharacterized protein n=2 Tax=Rosistilla carotiformis TaxID=2528017 RepID=A0A518JLF4_9BACT|nr:hypothetical protein Poly24_00530 [Rosistilla carotiformis]
MLLAEAPAVFADVSEFDIREAFSRMWLFHQAEAERFAKFTFYYDEILAHPASAIEELCRSGLLDFALMKKYLAKLSSPREKPDTPSAEKEFNEIFSRQRDRYCNSKLGDLCKHGGTKNDIRQMVHEGILHQCNTVSSELANMRSSKFILWWYGKFINPNIYGTPNDL